VVQTEKTNKFISKFLFFRKYQIDYEKRFVWNNELIPIKYNKTMDCRIGTRVSITGGYHQHLNGEFECTGKYIKQGIETLYEIKIPWWSEWLKNYVLKYPYNSKRGTIYIPMKFLFQAKYNESIKNKKVCFMNGECICTGKETDKLIDLQFYGFVEKTKIKEIK
jgi:hypothetical protein